MKLYKSRDRVIAGEKIKLKSKMKQYQAALSGQVFSYVAQRHIDGSRGIYSPEMVGIFPIVTDVTNEYVAFLIRGMNPTATIESPDRALKQ